MNKAALISIVGGAIVAVAIVLNFALEGTDDEGAPGQASDVTVKSAPGAPAAPQSTAQSTAQPDAQSTAQTAAQPTAKPAARSAAQSTGQAVQKPGPRPTAGAPTRTPPSFDIVRINPAGDTVMAGRAEADAKVRIYDGGKQIGEVQADRRGEWVFVPTSPLPPGSRRLSLEAVGADGKMQPSGADVVLVIPEKGKDIAGRAAAKPSQPLAMRVPRDPARAVQILQKPVPRPGRQASRQTGQRAGQQRGSESARAATIEFAIDAVDYDDAGRLDIIGTAGGGGLVHLYLDNTFLGRAKADARGHWRRRPKNPVAPGIYTLRADHVDAVGKVLARLEVHFSRSVPLTGIAPGSLVVVRSGNSLWRIARRTYGTGFKYTVIYDANRNQIKNQDLIYPGQVFALPSIN